MKFESVRKLEAEEPKSIPPQEPPLVEPEGFLTGAGEFQSKKFPETPPDCILIKFKDAHAKRALRLLAEDYRSKNLQLSKDINARLDAMKGA